MIIIASQRYAIQVVDSSALQWFGSGDLVGSSFLGLVEPTDRMEALRFVEQLAERPGVANQVGLRLVQRSGRVSGFRAFGAVVGDVLAVQLTRVGHATQPRDESLIWITTNLPAIESRFRPLVMAMVAGVAGRMVPSGSVVYDAVTASVTLPTGSSCGNFANACRMIGERASFPAEFGECAVAVRSDVAGVHFGDAGLTSRMTGDR